MVLSKKSLFSKLVLIIGLTSLSLCVQEVAGATSLVEDFEAEFPAWESGWLGTNSNLQNYYGKGQERGNNPDGLWLDDGDGIYNQDTVDIAFNPSFGNNLTGFAIDIASWVQSTLVVYDMNNLEIFKANVEPTYGAYTDPGEYINYSVSSNTGISKFSLFSTGGQIEGNTSIDNLMVTLDKSNEISVPEPSVNLSLFGFLAMGLGVVYKKRSL
jgi:hypothetical protein